jgi:hypothetical protein
MSYLPMANPYPHYTGREEEEIQPLRYKEIDTVYQLGMESNGLYYPVPNCECSSMFVAICEADNVSRQPRSGTNDDSRSLEYENS